MNYLKEEIAEFDQPSLIAPMRLANPNDDFFNFEDNCQPKSNDLELNEFLSDSDHSLESLNRFPTIREIFLKYNAATSSSAPVERLFSEANSFLTSRRNRLSDSLFESLLLLKFNSFQ